jgi:hypothetical protein
VDAKDFQRMFAYDDWANRECLAAMGAAKSISADTLARMAHILSAQKLWLERIQKQPQSMKVWPTSTLEECQALAAEIRIGVANLSGAHWQPVRARFAQRPSRIPQQQRRTLVQPRGRHPDACAVSLGVSSRTDRLTNACVRIGTRLYRFHPRRAPGLHRLDIVTFCHPERSEGSAVRRKKQTPHFLQNVKSKDAAGGQH